jgi:hypothetical protein
MNTAVAFVHSLSHLSDDDLLANTRSLVGRSNQIFAALLVHLAEVEARGLHRLRACSSLYAYCIYELRLSEDAAFRRVSAARLVKQFPALLGAIERGELHLTGVLLLGPHLTAENHLEVLVHAKHRTKKEIAKLVRVLDPLPEVPSRIEPLGPAPASPARSAPANPSWAHFTQAMNPVRELTSGDRPGDWMDDALERNALQHDTAPARLAPPLTGPQRYQVQFTASEEYVNLVERAKALLSRTVANVGLEELQLRAMGALVAELEKRKYAGKATPAANTNEQATCDSRQRGRAVPSAVQRVVWERDAARCTYVDPTTGQRCRETHRLELHHETAYAHGGAHRACNLSLRCAAHNSLAAEADFGREFIAHKKDALRHETYVKQSTSRCG